VGSNAMANVAKPKAVLSRPSPCFALRVHELLLQDGIFNDPVSGWVGVCE
jgi:hypothetical protein